jgi:hypothetical protein
MGLRTGFDGYSITDLKRRYGGSDGMDCTRRFVAHDYSFLWIDHLSNATVIVEVYLDMCQRTSFNYVRT